MGVFRKIVPVVAALLVVNRNLVRQVFLDYVQE